jgi:hypothetical protein
MLLSVKALLSAFFQKQGYKLKEIIKREGKQKEYLFTYFTHKL